MHLILASSSKGRKQLLSLLKIPFQVIPSTIDEDTIYTKTPLETILLRARLKGEDVACRVLSHKIPKLLNSPILIISADSGAIMDNRLIGKPKDEKEAIEILKGFSGKTHEFVTAIYVMRIDRELLRFRANRAVGLEFAARLRKGKRELAERSEEIPEGLPEQASLRTLSKNPFARNAKVPTYSTYDRSFVTMRKLSDEDIKLHIKLSNYTRYAGGYALFASPVDIIEKVEGSLTNVVGLPLAKITPILQTNHLL